VSFKGTFNLISRAGNAGLTGLLATLALLALTGCGGEGSPPGDAARAAAEAALRSPEYRQFSAEAGALHQQGDLRGALKQATRALSAAPQAREPWDGIGRLYMEIGRADEELQFFTIAARNFADSPHAHIHLGRVRYRLGQWDEALAAFDEALRLDPSQTEAHFQRGLVFQAQAAFDEALAAYRRALELAPDSPSVAARVARMQRVTGDYEGAMATVDRALALVPGAAELHYAKGQLLINAGEVAAAERSLRRALAENHRHGGAHYDLARLLLRDGREDEARKHQLASRRLNELAATRDALGGQLGARAGDPLVPIMLAELELTEDNFVEALNWLGRAEIQGGPPERIAAARAEALFGLGRLDEGEAALAALTGVTDGRAALARGAGLIARQRPAQAVPFLDRAVEVGPEEREFLRRVADFYEAAGRDAVAESLHERAVSAPPIQQAATTHASDE
jgi:tetratricopeptide (TPR) repeat protein